MDTSNTDLVAEIDPRRVDELEQKVRETAQMICAEQPDVPEPESLLDLDSFSVVQVLLELENSLDLKLLERMEDFQGETFRDLAEFILRPPGQDDEAAASEPDPADAALQDQTSSA